MASKIKMPKTYDALIQFTSALSLALKERDAYTRLHSDRVMNISKELGEFIQLNSREITLLRAASALHDIGKLGIPDGVLLKPGNLDDDEYAIIQSHSERGANIVSSVEQDGAEIVAQAIRHHHENFDGSGYPDHLIGESIPIFSRIITIVDNYDAMATRRVYHDSKSHGTIIDEMAREAGIKHDPMLFEAFIKLIERSEFRIN
jgi:HD-GYP domain-containing protein (c-di-GMP phosphodiesterase class II)